MIDNGLLFWGVAATNIRLGTWFLIRSAFYSNFNVETTLETPTPESVVDTIRALSVNVNNLSPTLHHITPDQLRSIQTLMDERVTHVRSFLERGVQTYNNKIDDLALSGLNQIDLLNKNCLHQFLLRSSNK